MPSSAVPVGPGRELEGAFPHLCLPGGGRDDLVHQPPFDGAFAAHAFLGGAEDVGAVAADPALVGQPGQAAGAGQHRQAAAVPADETEERRSSISMMWSAVTASS